MMRSNRTPEEIISQLELQVRFLRVENAGLGRENKVLRDENASLLMVVAVSIAALLFLLLTSLVWGG